MPANISPNKRKFMIICVSRTQTKTHTKVKEKKKKQGNSFLLVKGTIVSGWWTEEAEDKDLKGWSCHLSCRDIFWGAFPKEQKQQQKIFLKVLSNKGISIISFIIFSGNITQHRKFLINFWKWCIWGNTFVDLL